MRTGALTAAAMGVAVFAGCNNTLTTTPGPAFTTLQGQVATLQQQVASLQAQIGSLEGESGLLVSTTSDSYARVQADLVLVQGWAVHGLDAPVTTTSIGAGGIDQGSLAPSTWYRLFVIATAGTAVPPSTLLSTSATPLLPPGYTRFRRVGWLRTNGVSALRRMRQTGRFVHYLTLLTTNDSVSEIKRRIADNRTNQSFAEVDGLGANESPPGEFLPPGTREALIKAIMNVQTVAALGADAYGDAFWSSDGPAATAPNDNVRPDRRLTRCGAMAPAVANYPQLCNNDLWVTLNNRGTFFQATGVSGTAGAATALFLEVEGYLDPPGP